MNEVNQEAVSQILSLLEKKPIAFIGAGISQAYFKDWPGIVEELSKRLNIPLNKKLGPIDQAQVFYKADRAEYYSALKDVFGAYPEDCSPPLRQIVLLDFKSYITTNYDWSIEFAFKVMRQQAPPIHSYPNILEVDCHTKSIHHIHGMIDLENPERSSIILHRDSYEEAYVASNTLRAYLCSVFFHHPLIIIGYSMSEGEPINGVIDFALKKLQEEKIRRGPNVIESSPTDHAILLPTNFSKEELIRLTELGLRAIYFDPLDDNYSGFDEVWHNVALTKHRPTTHDIPKAVNSFDAMPKPEWSK